MTDVMDLASGSRWVSIGTTDLTGLGMDTSGYGNSNLYKSIPPRGGSLMNMSGLHSTHLEYSAQRYEGFITDVLIPETLNWYTDVHPRGSPMNMFGSHSMHLEYSTQGCIDIRLISADATDLTGLHKYAVGETWIQRYAIGELFGNHCSSERAQGVGSRRHIRWINQYIRNRTWMRSRRSELKTCVTAVHRMEIRATGPLVGIKRDPHAFLAMCTTLTNMGARTNPDTSTGPRGGQIPAGASLTTLCRAAEEQGGWWAAGVHRARGGSSSYSKRGTEPPEGLELVNGYSLMYKWTVWGLAPCAAHPLYHN
jgi:hypothetical protein